MLLTKNPRESIQELGNQFGGLRIDEIYSFIVLAEELHFSNAASRLFVSTGGLSRRVANLERILASTLLTRTTRNVELTLTGHRFARLGQILLAELQQLAGEGT